MIRKTPVHQQYPERPTLRSDHGACGTLRPRQFQGKSSARRLAEGQVIVPAIDHAGLWIVELGGSMSPARAEQG